MSQQPKWRNLTAKEKRVAQPLMDKLKEAYRGMSFRIPDRGELICPDWYMRDLEKLAFPGVLHMIPESIHTFLYRSSLCKN